MFYETDKNDHGLPFNPFKSTVVPRPIGWISTLDRENNHNLAPFSQFNNIGYDPAYVMFSGGGDVRKDGRKDSTVNAIESGEFVCNMATWELREEVRLTAGAYPPDLDEGKLAGLEMLPSRMVKPLRVARSPVHLECETYQAVTLPGNAVRNIMTVVIGKVVGVHINDDVITPQGRIDIQKIKPLCRMGYMDYSAIESVFEMLIEGPHSDKNLEGLKGVAKGKLSAVN